MRSKIFIYIIIFLLLLFPSAYVGFWYFAAWKAKNLLTEAISYMTNEEFSISYDFNGFPSHLILRVANPKFSNEQLTISFKELLVENTLLDKSVHISVPSNKFDISVHGDEKKRITCSTSDKNRLVIKLNDLLNSLKLDKNGTIVDYINTLRYEDYGLTCDVLSDTKNQESIVTEISDKSNHIQFSFDKTSDGNAKLGFDLYAYRYKNTSNPEDYLNIDTKFDCEFINGVSASSINFNIEKFLIQSDTFSFAASGKVSDYNLVTLSFKDKVDVSISNYKELISSVLGEEFSKMHPKASSAFEEFILSLSEQAADKSIQFTIKYDDDIGASFIGALPTTDFMNRLSKINQLIANENSN